MMYSFSVVESICNLCEMTVWPIKCQLIQYSVLLVMTEAIG